MSGHGNGYVAMNNGANGKPQPASIQLQLTRPQSQSQSQSRPQPQSQSHSHVHGHGASQRQPTAADKDKKSKKEKSAVEAWAIFKMSLPYLWPRGDTWLRVCLVLSVICLIVGSLADLYTPIAIKHAIDELTGDKATLPVLPVYWILVYGLTRFGANFAQQLRDVFFAAVGSETERRVALETFNHLQSLSLSFHLKRETGSVLRSVSRGAQSFATLARIVLFQIAPIFVQLAIVCVYLLMYYQWYFSLVTFAIIAVYFVFTFTTTNWRDKYRRTMNEADNEFNQKAVDALLNFETVKFFNAEKHEEQRYDGALKVYTVANTRVQQSLAVLNAGQNFIISFGIVLTLYLSARQVLNGEQTVGDFVLMLQFILQLYQPLGFLGTFWRMIKQNIVDVESMFKLLNEPRDIKDRPNAKQFQLQNAEIKFDNVSFTYGNGVPVLQNVSFTVKPGSKVAVVGASGSGKSTIARLLYRFYDTTDGAIYIDGQDIRSVTQCSLRQEIGIVPQDTVLFNDTIGYNIGYGIYGRRTAGATVNEIIEASKKASITDFIKRQPDGLDTKVGERGLRLSGGEKQRVSIARAILKSPRIMIFDEATSALDTHTEREIQQELDLISKGRSSITIAHRLSTIANSDLILVLDKGRIVEQGRHSELLAMNGLYTRMWQRQERAAELQRDLAEITKEEQQEKMTIELVEEKDVQSHIDSVSIDINNDEQAPPPSSSPASLIASELESKASVTARSDDGEDIEEKQSNKKKKKKKGQGALDESLL